MKNSRKALIVSYHFPPSASTGAIRPMKFVKYLSGFGWNPIVLTCNNSFDFGAKKNTELLKDVPKNTTIVRTHTFEPLNYWYKRNEHLPRETVKGNKKGSENFITTVSKKIKGFILDILNIPDCYQGWIPFAFLQGLKIIAKHDIDIIFATTPPPSATVVGYLLSVLTKKPLILDYRDPWTTTIWAKKHFRFFESLNKKIEHKAQLQAKYIISMSKTRANELHSMYSDVDISKHVIIPNGYDPEERAQKAADLFDKLTFIHAGYLYNNDGIGTFIDVITDLIEKDMDIKNNIKILFAGAKPDYPLFNKLDKIGIASYIGKLPRKECLDTIAKSHVSLVILRNDSFSLGCIASKVFDCMMLRKPILGIIPKGETKDLIEKTRTGVAVESNDKQGLKKAILDFYNQYKNGGLTITPDNTLIEKYDRRELTKQLAHLFNKTVEAVN